MDVNLISPQTSLLYLYNGRAPVLVKEELIDIDADLVCLLRYYGRVCTGVVVKPPSYVTQIHLYSFARSVFPPRFARPAGATVSVWHGNALIHRYIRSVYFVMRLRTYDLKQHQNANIAMARQSNHIFCMGSRALGSLVTSLFGETGKCLPRPLKHPRLWS